MRPFILTTVLLFFFSAEAPAQTISPRLSADETALRRNLLLTDLRALETEALKLDKPLASALAQAEIANAVWTLDQEWAKKLLREAYQLNPAAGSGANQAS